MSQASLFNSHNDPTKKLLPLSRITHDQIKTEKLTSSLAWLQSEEVEKEILNKADFWVPVLQLMLRVPREPYNKMPTDLIQMGAKHTKPRTPTQEQEDLTICPY